MRVLLADPPAKGTRIDDSYANLGILYLAGSLRTAFSPREITLSYLGPKRDLVDHVAAVRDFRPDVYGLSFTSKAARLAYRTLGAIREACPNTRILAGGAHPTALPGDVFANSPTDIVCPGEGECTCVDVVKALAGSSRPDLSKVAGLFFRSNGDVVQTTSRPVVKNLDTIPLPAWDMIDFRDYPGMHLKKQAIETSMLVSRGCPFRCTFCSQPVWKFQKPWLRARSVENICEEIDLLYARGVREIYLTSDEINFNEPWAIAMCEGIARLNHRDLYFQCNLRADKVSVELVNAMARMGCWLVHLGIESANDRVLAGIGKRITVGQVENAARLLSGAGINVFAFMMLYQVWEEDGQLQWETSDEVERSLSFIRRMFRLGHIHYMSWQICTPMPGAPLYEIARRHELLPPDAPQLWETFDEHRACLNLPGISSRTMQWKVKKGVLWKDWFMLRSGQIGLRHAWRVWENLQALVK